MDNHTKVNVSKLPFCDFCRSENHSRKAKYDAKTKLGPWANMCEYHYLHYGIGLGLGKGQELIADE
jgi:hypothetical protein